MRIYRTGGWQEIQRALPHRTMAAIIQAAQRLGANNPAYTAAEDKKLSLLWDAGIRLAAIAAEMGRSESSVFCRSRVLRLPAACPEGYEFICNASKRTGYYVSTLRKILAWAGVKEHLALSDPIPRASRRAAKWHRHYVDPLLVDEAIERWLKTETVCGAARARGLSNESLYRWLTAAGVFEKRKPGTRPGVRNIATEVIDRVVAQHKRAA